MNVYDESEKGKDKNYLYKNAERKKISNSKIIMVIGCGLWYWEIQREYLLIKY